MSDPFSRPSSADFLNAINATKFSNDPTAVPTGYTLLYSSTAVSDFAAHGLAANVYGNPTTGAIMFAYYGPVTISAGLAGVEIDPALQAAAISMNQRIANNDSTVVVEMEQQAANFTAQARNVALSAVAARNGIIQRSIISSEFRRRQDATLWRSGG